MKSKLLILLLFAWFTGLSQVPNHNHFTLGHVFFAVYGDSTAGRTTASLFTDSDAAKFDATYGSKTMNPQTINGFQNYGAIYTAELSANPVYFLTATTAAASGEITSDGGSAVTARGLCWAEGVTVPTILNSPYTTDGTGTGSFTSSLTGLTANTWYTVRAYATNVSGTYYSDHVVYHSTLEVGQYYQGGVVIYISGSNGLIMSPNLGTAVFGCIGTYLGAANTAIGSGQANTDSIVANCVTAGIAAKMCNDLSLNGYTDWYLPSRDEAVQMWQILSLTESNVFYWTSSEGDTGYTNYANYVYNNTSAQRLKDNIHSVRAIRSF